MHSPPRSPIPLLPSSPKSSGMKRKTSTSEVNCDSCGLLSSVPISCSGCYDYFCGECIDMKLRKCPRCIKEVAKKPPGCEAHGKELIFFCLTCEKETCGDCILNTTDHKRHTFDRLDEVYQEKISVTNDKLKQLQQQIDEIEKSSVLARNNLALIENTEEALMSELNLLLDAAKNEISETVDEKRLQLKERIDLPTKRKALLGQLEDKIKSLSQSNFIKQQDELNGECDKLREQCKEYSTDLIDYYDIGCELIPDTKLETFMVENFNKTDETVNVTFDDSTGDTWRLSIVKGNTLILTVSPDENVSIITSHQFKVVTEICHSDISKSLRKRFVIQRKMSQFELGNVEQLSAGGFLSNATLVLRIAIQPLNVVEACDHYKQKAVLQTKSIDSYKTLLTSAQEACENMKNDLSCLKNFSVGYYSMDFSVIQKQQKNSFVSPHIVDFNGNEWKMEIKFDRDEQNKIFFSAYMFPARIITASENSRRCTYFIELMHAKPDEIIRGYAEHLFEINGLGRGWKGFVERMRVLNDVGFLRNGKIWFRYGVRPTA